MPNQRSPKRVGVLVYLDRELKTRAQARAKERGETLTDVVRRKLEEDDPK